MARRTVRVRYKPANSKRDLPKGSKRLAMDAFLLSDRIQDVSSAAARDIAAEAQRMALAEGAVETGDYANSFEVQQAPPLLAGGNLRRAARVSNSSEAALAVEYSSPGGEPPRRILGRSGSKFHTGWGVG